MKCLGVEEMDRLKMLKLERSEDGWVGIQCLWEFQPKKKQLSQPFEPNVCFFSSVSWTSESDFAKEMCEVCNRCF